MTSISVIVPSVEGGPRLRDALDSLAAQTAEHETIVVDNGSGGAVAEAAGGREGVTVLERPRNEGFARAINLGARRAAGERLVLVNDDCVLDPGFVGALAAALDPEAGVAMAAGVLRDQRHPTLIETAGVEIDRTLLGFDYLNGEPLSVLDEDVADPIGPTGGAAGYDRSAFLELGGYDEGLFAYWEDVDLALRMREAGWRCALASDALGTHAHSATLGSGSARKNYLMGFGRGYVLRKWGVLRSPLRVAAVIARDAVICAGQLAIDRNAAGLRGRREGYRAASAGRYPASAELGATASGLVTSMRRRASRRARMRRGAA